MGLCERPPVDSAGQFRQGTERRTGLGIGQSFGLLSACGGSGGDIVHEAIDVVAPDRLHRHPPERRDNGAVDPATIGYQRGLPLIPTTCTASVSGALTARSPDLCRLNALRRHRHNVRNRRVSLG